MGIPLPCRTLAALGIRFDDRDTLGRVSGIRFKGWPLRIRYAWEPAKGLYALVPFQQGAGQGAEILLRHLLRDQEEITDGLNRVQLVDNIPIQSAMTVLRHPLEFQKPMGVELMLNQPKGAKRQKSAENRDGPCRDDVLFRRRGNGDVGLPSGSDHVTGEPTSLTEPSDNKFTREQ